MHKPFFIKKNLANSISILSLLPTSLGYFFIISGKPFHAIISISLSFFLDTLDGLVARKTDSESSLGRQIDSFADTANYLIFSALFTIKFLNFNNFIAITESFAILSFGIIRLSIFNLEGIRISEDGKMYYRGLPVPFVQLLVIILFLLSSTVSQNLLYLSPLAILIACLLMISNIRIRKYKNNYFWYLLVFVVIIFSIMEK